MSLVSAEDDAEVRRVSMTNAGPRAREIEITSYAELVLAPQAADVAHPAFAKLFVETEYLAELGAILSHAPAPRAGASRKSGRRILPSSMARPSARPEFETDRARFLGRGHGIRAPIAMSDGRPLSNTVGTVLDPIFALRRRVRIPPGATVRIAFWTMVAATRAKPCSISSTSIATPTPSTRATTLAWTQAQVQLHHLGITPARPSLFQRLAGHVLYADPSLASAVRDDPARRRRAIGALGAGHFRRSADRAVAHRRRRGSRHRRASCCTPMNIGG